MTNSKDFSGLNTPVILPIPKTRKAVARELRDMATAASNEYREFAYMKPAIRGILLAAADFLIADDGPKQDGP